MICRPFAAVIPILLGVLGGLTSGTACPICLGAWGDSRTLADEVMTADAVAVASSRDGVHFKIWHHLKGTPNTRGMRLTLKNGKEGARSLVARSTPNGPWFPIGTYDAHLGPFLKKTLPLRPIDIAPDHVWHDYLDLFRNDLGHSDQRIARSAWQIWAKAPFRVLINHQQAPPLESLRTWLADDADAYGKSLWIILLGIHGEEQDRKWIRASLDSAWSSKSDQGLSALLTAHCLQAGDAAIPWIESRYLRDKDRTLPEITAALTALGVIGTNAPDLRPRVSKTFLAFLDYRRPISGLVASDLAAWGIPDAAAQFRDMLSSGEPVLPQTRSAIQAYLDAHPESRNHPSSSPPPAQERHRNHPSDIESQPTPISGKYGGYPSP